MCHLLSGYLEELSKYFLLIFGGYSPAVIFYGKYCLGFFFEILIMICTPSSEYFRAFSTRFLMTFLTYKGSNIRFNSFSSDSILFDEADGNVAWKLLEQLRLPRVLGLFLLLKINFLPVFTGCDE